MWNTVLSVDLLLAIRNPLSFHQEFAKFYHLGVWGFAVMSSLAPLTDDSYGPGTEYFCWIDDINNVARSFSLWLFYVPATALSVFTFYVLVVAHRSVGSGLPDTIQTRRRVLLHSRNYTFIFGVYWLGLCITWAIGVIKNSDRSHPYMPLVFASVTVQSLRGLVNVTALYVNSHLSRREVGLAFRLWRRRIFCCSSRNNETQSLLYPNEDPLLSAATREKEEEDTLNRALRRDIMLCTAWGVLDTLDSFRNSRAHRSLPLKSRCSKRRIYLPASCTNKVFDFMDYDAVAFGELRERGGITAAEYQKSFEIPQGRETAMLEHFTEGSSGSFFYFTHDSRFLVKTITQKERDVLLFILPDYSQHLIANPKSLLVRFVGLHAIRMSPEQRFVTFVVMQNLFAPPLMPYISEKYDLKGSWVHRRVLAPFQHAADYKVRITNSAIDCCCWTLLV